MKSGCPLSGMYKLTTTTDDYCNYLTLESTLMPTHRSDYM